MAEFDSVIPAGSSGKLTAKMATKSTQRGRVSKSIAVTTDAPGQTELVLRFTVEVHMPVEASPSLRFIINLVEGQRGSARLLLSRDDGKPLEVERATVDTEGLTVTAQPATDVSVPPKTEGKEEPQKPWGQSVRRKTPIDAGPGDVWLELRSAPTLGPGTHSGSVHVETNHPEAPEIELQYTVRVRPLIEVRPDVVRLWTTSTAHDAGRSAILTVRHNEEHSFEITGIEVSHPQLFSAVATPHPAASQQTVRVSLADDLGEDGLKGSVQGWVRIATNDDERPLIEVPVLVAPSRLLSRRPVRTRPAVGVEP